MPIQTDFVDERTNDSTTIGSKHGTLISNIGVARLVMRMVASTLGPSGMSRIVLKPKDGGENEILLTSNGALVIENMKMEHPVAKLLATLASAQKDECGDGTTTAVILACSLLENAKELVEMGLHPSMIIEGYRIAELKAAEILEQKLSTDVDTSDDELMRSIARSVMNSRVIASSYETLELFTDFAVKLARRVLCSSERNEAMVFAFPHALDNIRMVKKPGESLVGSELILNGFLIDDREVVHPNMPLKVENALIALVENLEVKRLSSKAGISPLESTKIEATSLQDYKRLMQNRVEFARKMAKMVSEAGANVVLVNRGIDELVEHHLSRHRVLAVKRVKSEDMELIAKLTHGTLVGNVDELAGNKLGRAESVEEVEFSGDDHCIRVAGCSGVGTASIILRASGKQVLDEAERCLRTALQTVERAMADPRVAFGGGATEVELACELGNYALSFSRKEQFAIQRYARALEAIPRILAQNAGLHAAESIVDLSKAHRKGLSSLGIDGTQFRIRDMKEANVFDLVTVKLNAIRLATELAIRILRIGGIEIVRRQKQKNDDSALGASEYQEEKNAQNKLSDSD